MILKRAMRVPVLLTLTMVASGCGSHVLLSAPPASALPEQRVEAYDQLRPIGYQVTRTSVTSTSGASFSHKRVDFLRLNNGTQVELPEDLLPLVPANSSAAESLRAARSHRLKHNAYGVGTLVGWGGGALSILASALGAPKVFGYSGVTLLVGGFVCVPLTNSQANKRNAATEQAYDQYDHALRRRLDVCADGERTVPCPSADQ